MTLNADEFSGWSVEQKAEFFMMLVWHVTLVARSAYVGQAPAWTRLPSSSSRCNEIVMIVSDDSITLTRHTGTPRSATDLFQAMHEWAQRGQFGPMLQRAILNAAPNIRWPP